jgi:hypothetical protein
MEKFKLYSNIDEINQFIGDLIGGISGALVDKEKTETAYARIR